MLIHVFTGLCRNCINKNLFIVYYLLGDHNTQTVVVYVDSNTQGTGPDRDYEEVKDEPGTEKQSGKLQPEEKSVKENHNYHTLIPESDEEQISTSKV